MLRLRRVEGKATLTYKKALPTVSSIKQRREEETVVADPEAMEAILVALGFTPALVYEKRRQTWRLGKTEIVIDVLPFGLFMEIEGRVQRHQGGGAKARIERITRRARYVSTTHSKARESLQRFNRSKVLAADYAECD